MKPENYNNEKPEYIIEVRIIDMNLGKTVVKSFTHMTEIDADGSCESFEIEAFALLRAFERSARTDYEQRNY